MGFSEYLLEALTIQNVWEKGVRIPGMDPNLWRWDDCGLKIYRWDYGNRQSEYGWEKDHISPRAWGGQDNLSNLRPLHWRNNVRKGTAVPSLPWNNWASYLPSDM